MKGQAVFEFIVTVVLFMTIVIFVLNTLNSGVAVFAGDYFTQSLNSKAVAVSELLVRTKGSYSPTLPNPTPNSIGLASGTKGWPVLDGAKITSLQSFCAVDTNYANLLSKLDLIQKPGFGNYEVRIETKVPGTMQQPQVICGSPVPRNVDVAFIKRFGVLETGEIKEIDVWVW